VKSLVAERIRCLPCNGKIASSISVRGHFATPFSKQFNLTMLTMFALATADNGCTCELPGTKVANRHTYMLRLRSSDYATILLLYF